MMRSLIASSAVALATVGISTVATFPAHAASLTPNPGTCNVSRVSFASQCAGVYGSQGNNFNPSSSDVLTALNDDNLFGNINDWKFDGRKESPAAFSPDSLGLTLKSLQKKSGTFEFSDIGAAYTNLAIGLKAGNRYALYFIPKGTYLSDTVFNWSTADLLNRNGNPAELSHMDVFYQVPTPAMLPALVGMGIAALRKKKEQNDQGNDSTV